jgi:hypothetical protein
MIPRCSLKRRTPRQPPYAYTIDANRSLAFTLQEDYLASIKTLIEGSGGVETASTSAPPTTPWPAA